MKAWELLSDPKKWTRGALARTDKGLPIGPHEVNAVCFCVNGAITKVNSQYASIYHLQDIIQKECGFDSVAGWNDDETTTHDDIIRVLKKLDI